MPGGSCTATVVACCQSTTLAPEVSVPVTTISNFWHWILCHHKLWCTLAISTQWEWGDLPGGPGRRSVTGGNTVLCLHKGLLQLVQILLPQPFSSQLFSSLFSASGERPTPSSTAPWWCNIRPNKRLLSSGLFFHTILLFIVLVFLRQSC
jgi:hypothetical protein